MHLSQLSILAHFTQSKNVMTKVELDISDTAHTLKYWSVDYIFLTLLFKVTTYKWSRLWMYQQELFKNNEKSLQIVFKTGKIVYDMWSKQQSMRVVTRWLKISSIYSLKPSVSVALHFIYFALIYFLHTILSSAYNHSFYGDVGKEEYVYEEHSEGRRC